jgi:thioredoxin reductase
MQHDAIVIGGSYAGLSAAIHIARARRSVCVIDAGPRVTASPMHHTASSARMARNRML